ncbi:hypothetical protein EK21DRAFT_86033 [Setomelanomma holmii]|uniref:Integral membrane protein n=1 Tax=Setomelanomma holmii TaxID=210430 RepID=A0A9P4HH16_9PLEO|nr:hypothetical protein EK21DRAFT_86033 [Setomelanomma holmii]
MGTLPLRTNLPTQFTTKMRFVTILRFAAMLVAVAVAQISIIEFSELPACAKSCKILSTSEANCVPPATPVANAATYLSCFCQSDYLKTLRINGSICNQFCSNEDDLSTYEYYNKLCGTPFVGFTSSLTSLPPPLSASTSTWKAVEPTSTAPAPPKESEAKPRDHGVWLHSNWKYLMLAGVPLLFALAVLVGLAFLYRNHKKKREAANRRNNMIPLQRLGTSAPSRPTTRGEEDLNSMPAAGLSSPLASPGSPHSFQDSLRIYTEEQREQEQRVERLRRGGRLPVFPAKTPWPSTEDEGR